MNKPRKLLLSFKRVIAIVLFACCSLMVLLSGNEARAYGADDVVVDLGIGFGCLPRNGELYCELYVTASGVQQNPPGWTGIDNIILNASSDYSEEKSYVLGYVENGNTYQIHHYNGEYEDGAYYTFNVGNNVIKESPDSHWELNGFEYWSKNICVNVHVGLRVGSFVLDGYLPDKDHFSSECYLATVVEPIDYYLTGIPIDGNGNRISVINEVKSSPTRYGSMAQITRIDATGDDYAFVGWKDTLTGSITQTSPTYTESFMTGNKTVYAVYRKIERFILTGIPVDVNGNEISSIPKVYSSPTDYGLSAYIVRVDASGDGYSFMGWRDVPTGVYTQTGTTYIEQQMIGDKTVYAVYEKNVIVGKVDASSASGTDTTGWSSSDKTISHSIVNCPSTGCDGTFVHHLKITGGSGLSHYKIFRETGDNPGVSNMIKEGDYGGGKNVDSVVMTNKLSLMPGNKICETLVFDASLGLGNKDVSLTACILALGSAQGDEALLTMKVQNNNVDKYKDYQDLVYAKPSDGLNFQGTYNPKLQEVYNAKPQKIQINGGTIYPAGSVNTTRTFGELFNAYKGSDLANWNNAFSMRSENFGVNSFSTNYGGEKDDWGNPAKIVATNNHSVAKNEAGRELVVYAEMNKNEQTKSSPTEVIYTIDSGGNNVGNVKVEEKEVSAKAIVPYNFGTAVTITDVGSTNLGERMDVTYSVDLTRKTNRETSPKNEYETIANDMRDGIVFYIRNTTGNNDNGGVWSANGDADICSYFGLADDGGATCTVKKHTWGTVDDKINRESISFDVPDRAIGAEVCVAVAVYPNSSYPDNGSDYEHMSTSRQGDGQWNISKSECQTIGKKPTFQVWGGSVFASNDITTLSTTKRIISGGSLGSGEQVTFSSWVEGIVIANHEATGIASGAATGRSNSPAEAGSVEKDSGSAKYYCIYRVPLSIANYTKNSNVKICSNYEITGYSNMAVSNFDAELIIETLREYKEKHKDDENKEIKVTIADSPTDIGSKDIGNGEVFVLNKPDKDITISGDIKYSNGPYASLSQIPKMIIYGKNININCGVKNVDAIIIAKENINTCADISSDDVNNEDRSNQLVIRGALVVGGTIWFNRTYGAGAGKESGTPAEIVNYDTTIPLWQKNILWSDGYDTLTSVYQHELAPRY